MLDEYFWYSSTVGSLPSIAAMEASSAEARKTLAPLPRRLGKLRVEVDTTVDLSATRAWLPKEQRREGRANQSHDYGTRHIFCSRIKLCLTHAERASGGLCPCSDGAEGRVVALSDELLLVHAGGGGDPQSSGQLALKRGQQLAGSYDGQKLMGTKSVERRCDTKKKVKCL